LKKEGTCWVNIGDSYFSKPKSSETGGLQNKNFRTEVTVRAAGTLKKPLLTIDHVVVLFWFRFSAPELCSSV
jgi:hypothetical protein